MKQGISVLVADDDALFANMLVDNLIYRKFDCQAVASGGAVLEALSHKKYDVLLSDINMPGNEGLCLVDELNDKYPRVPIILMTGKPTVENAVGSLKRSVSDFLIKPFNIDDAAKAIETAIQNVGIQQMLSESMSNVDAWRNDLDTIYEDTINSDVGQAVIMERFLSLSLKNMVSCINDIHSAIAHTTSTKAGKQPCRHFNCLRFSEMVDVVTHSISVLEGTRKSFKSKELQSLRSMLQETLEKLMLEQKS